MKVILVSILLISSAFAINFNNEFDHPEKYARNLNGFATAIDQIIRSIAASLDNVSESVREMIENEILNIQSAIINGINEFQNMINKVREEINERINEEIRPCFEGVPEKLEEIGNDTRSGVEVCRENERIELEVIQAEINEYRDQNKKLAEGSRQYIQSCFNQSNFGDAIKCGVDAIRNTTATVSAIRENNNIIREIYKNKVRQVQEEARECIRAEILEGRKKASEVFKEVADCIKEKRSSTSTSIVTATESATTTTLATEDELSTTTAATVDELSTDS